MGADEFAERREFQRFLRQHQALAKIDDHWERLSCYDISGCGVRFVSPLRPPLNEDLDLHIEDLGRFVGRVVRHNDDGFVVELQSSDIIKEQLDDELSEQQPTLPNTEKPA